MFSCNIFRQGGVVVRRASGERIQVWFTLMRFRRLIKSSFFPPSRFACSRCVWREWTVCQLSSIAAEAYSSSFWMLDLEGLILSLYLVRILYCDLSVCGKTWRCLGFYYGSILYWQDSLEIVVKLKISYLSKTYLFKEEISIKSNFLELKFRSISCDLWTYTRFQVLKSARCIVYRTQAFVCVYV